MRRVGIPLRDHLQGVGNSHGAKAAIENNQRMEEQRQREYERAQLEAMRRQVYLDAQRANESSYTSSGRRAGNTRGMQQRGFQMPSDDELRKNWEKWREDYLRNQ